MVNTSIPYVVIGYGNGKLFDFIKDCDTGASRWKAILAPMSQYINVTNLLTKEKATSFMADYDRVNNDILLSLFTVPGSF